MVDMFKNYTRNKGEQEIIQQPLSNLFSLNIVNIITKSLLFLIVFLILFLISKDIFPIIAKFLVVIGNFIFNDLFGLINFKFYNEKNLLTIFFRFENPIIIKYEYAFVKNEFDTHFIFPIILFISISTIEYFKLIGKFNIILVKNVLTITAKILIGFSVYLLFYYFKLFLLSYHNSLKIAKFDKLGNIVDIVEGQSVSYKIFNLLNNIFNIYGGITFRLLIVVTIWAILFRRDQIKSLLK